MDIKETKEALKGMLKLAAILGAHLKDGAQVQDLMAVIAEIKSKPEVEAELKAAMADIQKVGEEMKDLQASEVLELVQVLIAEGPALLAALKK